jgi:threonine/homoserine/homoserine lactone efflux protein
MRARQRAEAAGKEKAPVTIYASLVAFIAAASLLTIAPGLDTALVLRTVATGGPRRAALAGIGIAVGCWASSGSHV